MRTKGFPSRVTTIRAPVSATSLSTSRHLALNSAAVIVRTLWVMAR